MPNPDTINTLEARGFQRMGNGYCRSCKDAVLWFKTPAGKWTPYNHPRGPESVAHRERPIVSHWATCPNAKHHKTTAAKPARQASPQAGLFEKEVA